IHMMQTRVKTLYRCHVILVKETLEAPMTQVRYFASSDLQADVTTLVGVMATSVIRGRISLARIDISVYSLLS
ncbi:MAG TPA: hypothetical protein VLA19_28260, partial [Herpetosiphonaceae bacterium]|nr:hypothetical protein [Herpetosiphonaceae bacterium]